jgi:hypothetical protein
MYIAPYIGLTMFPSVGKFLNYSVELIVELFVEMMENETKLMGITWK